MKKSILTILLLALTVIAPTASLTPKAKASSVGFTVMPPSYDHKCIINAFNPIGIPQRMPGPYYSYVGGAVCYGPLDGSGNPPYNYFPVNNVSIAASFGGTTNYANIGNNNWLAAGMFLTGMDNAFGGEDYAYYMVIVLDQYGNFYLDVGAWAENDALLSYGWINIYNSLVSLFDTCYQISGISYQNPITLNLGWGPHGTLPTSNAILSWSVTVNGQTIDPPNNCVNITQIVTTSSSSGTGSLSSAHPCPSFYVGQHQVDIPLVYTMDCSYFQYGIMSPGSMQYPGWQVTLSNPQYENTSSGPWQNPVTSISCDGYNSFVDVMWMWGEKEFTDIAVNSTWAGWDFLGPNAPNGTLAFYYYPNMDGNSWLNGFGYWDRVAQETLNIGVVDYETGYGTVSTATAPAPLGNPYYYDYNASAIVYATPAPGYQFWEGRYLMTVTYVFDYWLVNGSVYWPLYNSTLTLPMTASYNVTADFCESVTGGPSHGCVLKGTGILMADGKTVPVQSLKLGDRIAGYDLRTASFVAETVTCNNCTIVDTILSINSGLLFVTPTDQPIYTDHGWIRNPQDLQVGWKIYCPEQNTWITIKNLKTTSGKFRVFDLLVSQPDSFIANSVLLDPKT